MKNWISKAIALAIISFVCWIAWGYFFPNETNRICRRLNNFGNAISFSSGASPIVRMAGADSSRDYFTTDIVIAVDEVHTRAEYISGRAEVINIITLARTHLQELSVKFKDPSVTLNPQKTEATMDVIAQVIIDETKRNTVHQLMRIHWIKQDDKWRMERIETLKMLGRESEADYFPARE